MKIHDDRDWADYFHYVLPDIPEGVSNEINLVLCRYRAMCQVELGKWMFAREMESRMRGGQ
jgi:hypothetical protein